MTDDFKEYGKQIIKNAKAFADKFIELEYKVISNGTQNHMFVLDVYNTLNLTGKEVEEELDKINITVNKNQIPNDTLPPLKSSGIRIGVPAMTTKGFNENDFEQLAKLINLYLKDYKDKNINEQIIEYYKEKVKDIIDNRGGNYAL